MAERENKHDKFKRLATRRVQRIIEQLVKLQNLSKPSYEYTEEEVEKIFTALQEAINNTRVYFNTKKTKSDEFEL